MHGYNYRFVMSPYSQVHHHHTPNVMHTIACTSADSIYTTIGQTSKVQVGDYRIRCTGNSVYYRQFPGNHVQ